MLLSFKLFEFCFWFNNIIFFIQIMFWNMFIVFKGIKSVTTITQIIDKKKKKIILLALEKYE